MLKYKYMGIEKIIETLKETQAEPKAELLAKTFDFFQKHTAAIGFFDKKNLQSAALDAGLDQAKENALPEFVAANMLFGLARHDGAIIKDIREALGSDVADIVQSHEFTRQQFEETQKPLYDHSCRTAARLATVKISVPAICAALLHEIPAHTAVSMEELKKKFSPEISGLTENFQKIRNIRTANSEQFVYHLREMVLAMVDDLRVIIIKMCSNLDRIKHGTELAIDAEKMKNIARESRELLAPVADLLGIWQLRWQLEDAAFEILEPEEFKKIAYQFNVDERKNRDKYIQKTKNIAAKALAEANIACQIEGRFKHFYSIHRKMLDKKKGFDDIGDIFALRIIVNEVDHCYRALGIIHRLWRPKFRRIKDYIAAPKSNNYRSLHTTVFGVNGRATEFQIRTREMDETANFGVAAHWYYKNARKKVPPWIQELLVKQQEYKNDAEFLTKFKSDILNDRIYVYTPKGDVVSLPAGATPIDFAYHIHSEIGHKCAGAKVNDLPVAVNTPLATNDIIEIIVDRTQPGPKREWLTFVKTEGAKKHIENHFNRLPVERSFRL